MPGGATFTNGHTHRVGIPQSPPFYVPLGLVHAQDVAELDAMKALRQKRERSL
jgi:hypothetical protein